MRVDFAFQSVKTKSDRLKQEEFLEIIQKGVIKYTKMYILCNRLNVKFNYCNTGSRVRSFKG